MPERHVKALIYEIRHGASAKYDGAQSATFVSEKFDVGISDSKAAFEFRTQDIETEAEALETVSDYIERWELSAGLALGPDAFRLEYKMPLLEERNQVPGQVRLVGRARFHFEMGGDPPARIPDTTTRLQGHVRRPVRIRPLYGLSPGPRTAGQHGVLLPGRAGGGCQQRAGT